MSELASDIWAESARATAPTATRTLHEPSLRAVFANTDLEARMAEAPDAWAARGAFFAMLDDRAAELGTETQRVYRDFFKIYKFSPFKLYPMKDYLARIAVLSQIHFGSDNVYGGIFQIQAAAYPAWRKTLIGRAMFGMLGLDFDKVLGLIEKTYASKSFTNCSALTIERHGGGRYTAVFRNEPNWIEHAMTGALEGVARVFNQKVDLEAILDDRFNGRVEITMQSA